MPERRLQRFDCSSFLHAYLYRIFFAVDRKIKHTVFFGPVHILYEYAVAAVSAVGFRCRVYPFPVSVLDIEVVSPEGYAHGILSVIHVSEFGLDGNGRRIGPEQDCQAGGASYLFVFPFRKSLETAGVYPVVRIRSVHQLSDKVEIGSFGECVLYILGCLGCGRYGQQCRNGNE